MTRLPQWSSLRRHAAPVVVGLLIAPVAQAHIALKNPTPRHPDEPLAISDEPCGKEGSRRGENVTTYSPGERVEVVFNLAVIHTPPTDKFRIAIDDDGQDFPMPKDSSAVADLPLAVDFEFSDLGDHTAEITIPDIQCDNCTLQLLQYLTTDINTDAYYFNCADLVIGGPPVSGAGGATSTGGRGSDGGGSGEPSGGAGGSTTSVSDAGTPDDEGDEDDGGGGGGCSTTHAGGSSGPAGLAAFLLVLLSCLHRRRWKRE
jgi:MYXO-CTERM domain-containing protein